MRSITSHKSELTAAIANIYGRNLQYATDEQLRALISRCATFIEPVRFDDSFWIGSLVELSRQKDGATLSASVSIADRVDALRTLSILAIIAADREADRLAASKIRAELNEIVYTDPQTN